MTEIDGIEKPPLAELRRARTSSHVPVVQAEIERLIRDGELKPGERINESALAVRLGVSRGPIREAARLLEQAGLLRGVLNRGLFVVELSFKEAFDIYDVRAALFALAGSRAAQNMTAQYVAQLEHCVAAMDEAIAQDAIADFYPANRRFHDVMVASSGNDLIVEQLAHLERRLHLFRRQGLVQPGAMRASNGEHRALLQALKAGDAAQAATLAQAHIAGGKNRLLQLLAQQAHGLSAAGKDAVARGRA